MSVRALGTFEASVNGNRIPDSAWKLKKAKSVIKLLVIAKDHRLHRDIVLDALWPDLEADSALNNLHKSLFVARRALEPGVSGSGSFISFQGETLVLDADGGLETDIQRFESLVSAARLANSEAEYAECVAAYGGELLPDDLYEEWSISRREELRTTFQTALSEYADIAEPDAAIQALQRMISIDPGLESTHTRLMKLFIEQGDRHRAIRQYQSLANTLKSEFGIEPQPATQSLYSDIVDGRMAFAEPTASAPVKSADVEVRSFKPGGPPLAGRQREMAIAATATAALENGTGSLLLLSGPAGAGKSRLAEEIAHVASLNGAHVMHGAAYEFERQAPYGPFSDAIDSFLATLPVSARKSVVDAAPVDIYPLIPRATHQLGLRREATESQDREFLFSAVETLMRSFTRSAPVVLIIDDLHAADESALELFHFLSRQTSQLPILIIATYRADGEALNSDIARVLAALNRIGVGSRIDVGPLTQEDVESIVARVLEGTIDHSIMTAAFDTAEGNPLFVEEIVRTMVETGSIARQGEKWEMVSALSETPEAIKQLLTDRMDRLSDNARQILSVASVIGAETEYQLLKNVSGMSEDVVLDSLDELLGRHIVLETDEGYRFSHGLHRDVAYESMSRARRRKAHADVANCLIGLNPDAKEEISEALAHHFLSAGQRGKAVPHLISAGQKAASLYANEEALESFNQAQVIIQENSSQDDPSQSGSLLESIGDIHARIGNAQTSLDFYKQAMAALQPVDPMASITAQGKAALAAINAERVEEGDALLQSILANISPDYPDFAVSRTYLLLAQIGWHSADHESALDSAEKALNAALTSGDEVETARAYEAMALSCHSLGDWQKGIEYELSRSERDVPGFDTDTAFDAHL